MEATDLDADGLIAQMRAMANEEVRADLALRALADSEGLEVTDAELAAEISRVAAEANRSESEVARQVAEGGGLERLRSDIRNSKAVEWLLDHVEVVDEQGNPMDRALLLEHDGSPDEPRDTTVDESVDSPETADTIAEAADPSDTEESRA
jgi:trigger factor